MATGTDRGGTWNTTAGNKTVVATPASGDLVVVIHGISDWVSGDASVITDNNSDGLGVYTRIGTATAPLSTGGGTAGALWISVRNAFIGSASSTTFTATNTGDTGGGLTVLTFSGMTHFGSLAIRQVIGESTQTENPPTITFPYTTLTANPVVLGVLGEDNPAALTPPGGFSEADDTGWNSPATGIEVCWDDSGNTATLFSFTGGALTDHNEVGVELDSSTVPSVASYTPIYPARIDRKVLPVAAMLALAFVPPPLLLGVPPDTTTMSGAQGGGGLLRPPALLQYQALTGPVLVPAAGAETITLDKWAPRYADRVDRGIRVPIGFSVGPVYVPDVTQPVVARSWAPGYPDRAPRARPSIPSGAVAPLHVPDVTDSVIARSWAPSYPDRLASRRPTLTGGTVAPLDVSTPTVPTDWRPSYAGQPARASTTGVAHVAPIYVPDVTVVAPSVSYPIQATPAWKRLNINAIDGGVGFSIIDDVPGVPVVVYPDRIERRRPVQLSGAVAPLVTVAAPAVPDHWAPRYPDRVPPRPRLIVESVTAPLYVPDVTVAAPARSWAPTYPDRAPGARRSDTPAGAVAPVFVADVTTPAPARSWSPVYPDRAPGRTRLTPPPFLAQNIDPITSAPGAAPDQWTPVYPDRAPGARRVPVFPQPVAPIVVPDVTDPAPARSWTPIYPDRIPPRPRAVVFAPFTAPIYVADVTVVAPVRSWAPIYPERVWRKVPQPLGWFVTIDTVDLPPPVVDFVGIVTLSVSAPTVTLAVSQAELTLGVASSASVTLDVSQAELTLDASSASVTLSHANQPES